MNRAARRRQRAEQRQRSTPKASRDATTEEIFPGAHGPLQDTAGDIMRALALHVAKVWPGHDLAFFVFEPAAVAIAQGRAPRFNYASTVSRPDMVAVLKAFIEKNAVDGPKVDRIEDTPPTERRQ